MCRLLVGDVYKKDVSHYFRCTSLTSPMFVSDKIMRERWLSFVGIYVGIRLQSMQ